MKERVFRFDNNLFLEVKDELVDPFFILLLLDGKHGDGGRLVVEDISKGKFKVDFAHGGDTLNEVLVSFLGGWVEQFEGVDVFELSDLFG